MRYLKSKLSYPNIPKCLEFGISPLMRGPEVGFQNYVAGVWGDFKTGAREGNIFEMTDVSNRSESHRKRFLTFWCATHVLIVSSDSVFTTVFSLFLFFFQGYIQSALDPSGQSSIRRKQQHAVRGTLRTSFLKQTCGVFFRDTGFVCAAPFDSFYICWQYIID